MDKDIIIIQLLKQNKDLQKSLIDISKEKTINNTTNNNHNSHNKTFNIQLFLNETFNDALNITDFVNSIQLQLNNIDMDNNDWSKKYEETQMIIKNVSNEIVIGNIL